MRIRVVWMASALACAAALGKPSAALPGIRRDGTVVLPNQWSLRPVGRQIPVGDFPVNIALHPAGRYAAVVHNGWGEQDVRIIDLRDDTVVESVGLGQSFIGLTWSPDGKQLYASGAGLEVVHAFDFDHGLLSHRRELKLRDARETGFPAGMATSRDGRELYVAETWGQRVEKISAADGHVIWVRQFSTAQAEEKMDAEGERTAGHFDNPGVFPYTCVADETRGRVYVSLWAKHAIAVIDAATGAEIERWSVGDHPNEMVLASDGRLFVAEANRNSVSVVDVKTGHTTESLNAAMSPNAPPGSMPNSVALTPDERVLFVANANNNDVAVFDVSDAGHAVSLGFIPVGWFPTSVRVTRDGKKLVVANGKGITSAANPRGPFPNTPVPRDLQEFIGGLLRGTVSVIPLPSAKHRAEQIGEWTRVAYACTPQEAASGTPGNRTPGNPIPAKLGEDSPIKHVIYIVRENRTYDQVLGDMPEGNGAAQLCLFGEKVTPNAHALAREFVLFDNFFADGEVSADGHEWTMGAYATDFVERMWPFHYGHKTPKSVDYPAEGRYPIAYPANGYLWNRAAEANVTYRSYGEFCSSPKSGPVLAKPGLPVLVGHIDPYYRAWDLRYPDVNRADRFAAEIRRFEAEGDMPQLQVLRLGNDHTEGTKRGARTPTALVADNDLAVGKIIEAVSHSKFWPATAVFILEDDAQNGPDHVDAHRMPVLVVSPWTKRHFVDSTLYSTTSMLRTMELILKLQPMSQFDAAALPLWNAFRDSPDVTAYTARPAQVDLSEVNLPTAPGAEDSARMDFSEPDRVDDIQLNRVVWRSVRGAHSTMPAPVRAAFFKAHPGKDDDD